MPSLSDGMRALLDRLRHSGEELFGGCDVEIVPLTFDVRESSDVTRARVITSNGIRYVFAKVFRPRPGEIGLATTFTRFRRDCEVMRHVSIAMQSTPELRSVEPIAWYDDLLGMVTNEVPGLPLSTVVSRNASWPTGVSRLHDVEVALHRAGRWVAAFQRVAPDAEPSGMSLDATREYIDVRLQRLTRLRRAGFGEEDRRAVLAHYDRCAAEAPSAELVDVPVHGDIVPSNIVVAPDSVTVLDFGMTARGSKYLDIARLYTQLEFHTAKPQYRPHVIARLQRAALTGFAPELRPDNPLFEICAVQHVVCHLLSQARQPGPFPVSVYSAHQCRRHRRWLRERTRETSTRDVARDVAINAAQ